MNVKKESKEVKKEKQAEEIKEKEMEKELDAKEQLKEMSEVVEAKEKVAEEIDQQPELLKTDQDFIMWPEPAIDLIRTDAFLELRAARHQDPMSPPVDWESMRQRLAHLRWVMQQMETHDE